MATSGTNTRMTVKTATPVIAWSVMRRRQLMGETPCCTEGLPVRSDMSPRRLAAGDRPHQKLCQGVHDDRYHEQRQTYLNQGGKVGVASSFTELVGEDAGHGVAGSEQGLSDL